ncbi:hypothetical protein BsWGS_17541 [Bradybaena similaris]
MQFVPMTTINKKASALEIGCSDWVATEKIHGSSFQFFTHDGETVYVASRRTVLDVSGSFLKCSMQEFHQRHLEFVKLMYQTVKTEDKWQNYRASTDMVDDDDEEIEEGAVDDQIDNEHNSESGENAVFSINKDETELNPLQAEKENEESEMLELRIYGEIYGGGGINKDIKSAVQKEIIYADEFRFYVFGVNINRKWANVTEMNDLCLRAGFPYYGKPICSAKPTLEELTQYLITNGTMKSKSRLTDKTDDNIIIEGVVMTPLIRTDFGFHAVKLLSNAFNDVRTVGKGKNQKANFCTKARYHSVLSKLDLPEREDADMVAAMFIADIIKEAGELEETERKKNAWTRCVRTWLVSDGYIKEFGNKKGKAAKTSHKNKNKQTKTAGDDELQARVEQLEDDNDEEGNGLGGLWIAVTKTHR